MYYSQAGFDICFEWGLNGLLEFAPASDVVIIVDVLSFSTCVDIATAKGAVVYPYQWKDETASEYAKGLNVELADLKRKYSEGYSLSPNSLMNIPAGSRIVLPSPNGSALSLSTGETKTICGCIRNAKAVAEYSLTQGQKIAVIAAGEKWNDNSLRPAFEDIVGAGAIISYLKGSLSPESKLALAAYLHVADNLLHEIKKCGSGIELIDRGFEKDIDIACELNVSINVPLLRNKKYESVRTQQIS